MTLEEAIQQIDILKKQLELYQYSYAQMVKQMRELNENTKKD